MLLFSDYRTRSSFDNTVDLKTVTYSNAIGTVTLTGSWSDELFDPDQHAFYYAPALEVPTPRWSSCDAVRHKLPLLEDVPAMIQKRARMPPIRYSPAG